ncbi:uncharacterized protein SPPG_07620 [Spizellomyces punctatus DAOM BR117]|uniref:chitin synthase n=1 Tax=Spizellomyces punctatus (strain DAOM BR117) TaxID=645134 RepID=A0A0L0H995_SPIPD|nr:uncharacterized protein SPPG_07620 [Spizellomyces punctatus DAOM BR117]KNC97233.1 hypothetical protein SPPG_07620 [Spizellomyces punctatus DAOM BR117]|eukprot:XP_016605273.1 hypothetical protein SPPG_07620 [Spizellomyces punctatus DAOM BR117]
MRASPLRSRGKKEAEDEPVVREQEESAFRRGPIRTEPRSSSAKELPVIPTVTVSPSRHGGTTSLQQRSGFPHQTSYENLNEIAEGKEKELPAQPFPGVSQKADSHSSSWVPASNALTRQKSVKVDTPSHIRRGSASHIFLDTRAPPTPSVERGTLRRANSIMIRPERAQDEHGERPPAMTMLKEKKKKYDPWTIVSRALTCWIPTFCIERFGRMHDPAVQQAWREKVALCTIITFMCGLLGFLTYGFVATACRTQETVGIDDVRASTPNTFPHRFVINGIVYDVSKILPWHNSLPGFTTGGLPTTHINQLTGVDVTPYFWPPTTPPAACKDLFTAPYAPSCGTSAFPASLTHCHDPTRVARVLAEFPAARIGPVTYEWPDIVFEQSTYMAFKERVLDMRPYLNANVKLFGNWTDMAIRSHLGKDASRIFGGSPSRIRMGECLIAMYAVGRVEERTLGCIASDIVLYVSLIIILSVVLIRFAMAILFDWFISWQLGKLQQEHAQSAKTALRRQVLDKGIVPFPMKGKLDGGSARPSPELSVPPSLHVLDGRKSVASDISGDTLVGSKHPSARNEQQSNDDLRRHMPGWSGPLAGSAVSKSPSTYSSPYGLEVYTVMLVTAYSEGEEGLRNTMDSLANTTYSDDHKLMFIVADGLITGSGNDKSTPEIIIDMLEMDKNWPTPPAPMSYVAISEGTKRHNMAQVYVAWYNSNGRCIPTILVVKCGTPEEADQPKPGNRGKRDSQIILMSFFQKVTFDDPMAPLDYDLFQKIHYLMGVTPDMFEIVLMVDADTKVAPDSLARMVASMVSDPMVMGLCGETRIANKSESWVSRIQVFEYYLSHHLAKAFESVFGGVTCLPGCFCMYRIKAPKGDGYWVPILCNPDIVATYSENRVDTLHKKNLLLLGEDRFLTTLMLGTFPHRKQIFVPRAFCKTVVPAEFKVLLSQRRRWINSTIHNLLELVLVRELCGVFCFSMQFVIMLELIGTVVLPAAIIFTLLLLVMAGVSPEVPWIPLGLLAAILGLPAILIMLTTKRRVYIYWMLIYLLALPIWNFVLPVYAFWHFDDFSWGQTRKVAGEGAGDKSGHGAAGEGEKDGATDVPRRRWVDWETERRKAIVLEWELENRKNEVVRKYRQNGEPGEGEDDVTDELLDEEEPIKLHPVPPPRVRMKRSK